MIELKQIRKDYGERTVIKNQSLPLKTKNFLFSSAQAAAAKQPC